MSNTSQQMIYTSTEYSGNARALKPCDIINRAVAMKADTVIVADHNTMCAAPEIIAAVHQNNMKASVGIKLTICFRNYQGLIALIPKDHDGFIAIGKLFESLTAANESNHPIVSLDELEQYFNSSKANIDKVIALTGGMDGLLAELVQHSPAAASDYLDELATVFGRNNIFAEVQYHGLSEEAIVFKRIADIADTKGIHLLATNDPYFVHNTKEDRIAYHLLRFADAKEYYPMPATVSERYIKTPDELENSIGEILTSAQCSRAMQSRSDIASMCNVQFPKETHYPFYQNNTSLSSDDLIKKQALAAISHRCPNWTAEHEQRLFHELSIIQSKGFSDYILIAADIVNYAKDEGKRYYKHNCLPVGVGRGSSTGSLVCYLLGITDVDPIQYGLSFDRFISPSRKTMPDIDIDIAASIRPKVIEHVITKYGSKSICGIYTPVRYRAKEAISISARFLAAKTGKEEYDVLGQKMSSACFDDSSIDENREVLKIFLNDSIGKNIIKGAKLIDGRFKTFTKHPCGIVMSDSDNISDYIPVFYDRNGKMLMTQCETGNIESVYGLLKMDLLSMRIMDTISNILASIETVEKTIVDFSSIPEEYEVFLNIFHNGRTEFIFQFGSLGMQKQLKKIHPMTIRELMLINAAYRPGPMKCLEEIRKVLMEKNPIEYLTPLLKPILKETCGCIIYQEQVMQIFTDIAGYTPEDADRIRAAISKKKKEIITAEQDAFIKGCMSNGVSEEVGKELYGQIVTFGEFAFNRSHAAAYSVLAYRMAWLYYHYPAHFLAHSFASNRKKVNTFFRECCRLGIKLLPPDINCSGECEQVESDGIRIGLSIINGVSSFAKNIENGKGEYGRCYDDLPDFLSRIIISDTALKNLALCGTFDSFKSTRSRIAANSSELIRLGEQLEHLYYKLAYAENPNKKDQLDRQINEVKGSIQALSTDPSTMDMISIIKSEQELMGIPLSFSMLHAYEASGESRRTTTVKEITPGKHRICGIVYSYRELKRKSDKAPFCCIDFEDETGMIECMLPVKHFWKYEKYLSEGEFVCLSGEYVNKGLNPVFWIEAVSELEPTNISYRLEFKRYNDFLIASAEIKKYTDYPLANLYIRIGNGEWTKYEHKVSPEIVNSFPDIQLGKTL